MFGAVGKLGQQTPTKSAGGPKGPTPATGAPVVIDGASQKPTATFYHATFATRVLSRRSNAICMKEIQPLSDAEQQHLRATIGYRCKRAREELGYSQRRLAETMQRSPSWVREIENGDQYAPPYLVKSLSSATGHSIGWFYGDDTLEQRLEHIADELITRLQQHMTGSEMIKE